jgi:hypothetical protein
MKGKFIAVAIGLSLPLSGARANDILTIWEHDENMVVTFNGAPLSGVTITRRPSSPDIQFWEIVLPSGFTFAQSHVGEDFELAEPLSESAPTPQGIFNHLRFLSSSTFVWASDVEGLFDVSNHDFTPNAGTGPNGTFGLSVIDSIPDSGMTVMLLATALSGLSLLRRFARR